MKKVYITPTVITVEINPNAILAESVVSPEGWEFGGEGGDGYVNPGEEL